MSKVLQSQQHDIAAKRYYFDVKENDRGRFINFAELNNRGMRSHIVLSFSTASEVMTKLTELLAKDKEMGEHDGSAYDRNNVEKIVNSETLHREWTYNMDFKENRVGRFVHIGLQGKRGGRNGMRSRVAVPVDAMQLVVTTLEGIIEKFGGPDVKEAFMRTPEPGSFRTGNKIFYFDVAPTARGVNLSISDVRPTFRTGIIVPDRALLQFRDMVNSYVDKMEQLGINMDPKPEKDSYNKEAVKSEEE